MNLELWRQSQIKWMKKNKIGAIIYISLLFVVGSVVITTAIELIQNPCVYTERKQQIRSEYESIPPFQEAKKGSEEVRSGLTRMSISTEYDVSQSKKSEIMEYYANQLIQKGWINKGKETEDELHFIKGRLLFTVSVTSLDGESILRTSIYYIIKPFEL